MPAARGQPPVVAIHAGAGDLSSELREHEPECRQALQEALAQAQAALDSGQDAVHAVEAAIVVLESFELFNAGVGSALCADGSVEMSAALMRGPDRAAGAVAAVRHTEHPILGARAVLDSPQVLMVGKPADDHATRSGATQRPSRHFITERQLERLKAEEASADRATVGAVCLDADGTLAAGTSTGGIRGQPPGRVGDCPIIGAGTWANRYAAVSCTGDGEAFVRCATAREVAALVEQRMPLAQAGEQALQEVAALTATGGLIAVDWMGNATTPFITAAMPRGIWRSGKGPTVWVT